MNLVSLLLSVHLIGATAFALVLVGTAVVLLKSKADRYTLAALAVAALTLLEIASGITLSIITSDGVVSMCAKAGIYLAVAGMTEYVLYRQAGSWSALLGRAE